MLFRSAKSSDLEVYACSQHGHERAEATARRGLYSLAVCRKNAVSFSHTLHTYNSPSTSSCRSMRSSEDRRRGVRQDFGTWTRTAIKLQNHDSPSEIPERLIHKRKHVLLVAAFKTDDGALIRSHLHIGTLSLSGGGFKPLPKEIGRAHV